MSADHDWAPFALGIALAVVGSGMQYQYLRRLDRDGLITEVKHRLELEGDIVQLIAAIATVVPIAFTLVHGKLLIATWSGGILLVVVAVTLIRGAKPDDYHHWTRWIFSPACDLTILLCLAGLLAAVL